jgi:hypothetical protein
MRRNNPFAESPSDRLYRGAFAAWRKEGFLMSRRAKLLALTLAMLGLLGVATAAQAGTQLYSGSLIVEAFGRDEGTPSYPYSYFGANPLGAYCNTYEQGTYCGTTTLREGAPLTGMGAAVTDGMGGFTLPASDLTRITAGSFAYFFPYLRSYSYATLTNQKGNFFAGGGPGNISLPYTVNGTKVAKVAAKQGSNPLGGFGGTMQLLGAYRSRGVYFRTDLQTVEYQQINWGWDILGASAMGTGMGTYYFPRSTFVRRPWIAKNTALRWTTGTVTATATGRGGPLYYGNTQQRKGYDNRTPTGQGTIQLVTPLLTHWVKSALTTDTAGIAILRIAFGLDSDDDGVVDANDDCPDSNPEPESTVVIEGCDSGVSNTQLARGCTISERIQQCEDDVKNHGAFRRCVSMLGDSLQKDGVLTGPEKDRILSCSSKKTRRPRQRSGILSWIFPSVP